MKAQTGITVIAFATLAASALCLWGGYMLYTYPSLSAFSVLPLPISSRDQGILLVVFALGGLTVTYGLTQKRSWARLGSIALSLLGLVVGGFDFMRSLNAKSPPTSIGLYVPGLVLLAWIGVVWFLTRPNVKKLFHK